MLMNEVLFDLLHGLAEADSRLYVLCGEKERGEAAKFFQDSLTAEWDQAVSSVTREHQEDPDDMMEMNPNPVLSVESTEEGFVVTLDPMFIANEDGDYYDNEKSRAALKNALKALKEKYPKVRWHGYIQYEVSDLHGSGYTHYEVYSDEELRDRYAGRTFDFEGREDGIYSAITIINDRDFPDPEDVDFFEHLEDTAAGARDLRSICRVLLLNAKDLQDTKLRDYALSRLLDCAEDLDEDAVPQIQEIIDAWKEDPDSVLMDPDAM